MMKKIEDVKRSYRLVFNSDGDGDIVLEMAAQRAMFESAKKSGANEVSGGACKKFISKKISKIGQNFKKNGDPFAYCYWYK